MKKLILLAPLAFCLACQSHQQTENQLTANEIQEIKDSTTKIVNSVFEYSNNMDFKTGLNYYSTSQEAYFVTDGIPHTLDELRESYREVGPMVEGLHNNILSWNVQVLSKDVVTFTLPVDLKLKLKGVQEFEGRLIWTATLHKQNDQWMIVQSHESWLDCAEVAAALTRTDSDQVI